MITYTSTSRFSLYSPNKIEHRGKLLKDIVSSSRFSSFYATLGDADFRLATVSPSFENRPDLISNAAYGTPGYWWVIILANAIEDPLSGLKTGDEIKIPIL
tara:strand:+ start:1012 stop:1314 length:303 start_codon:yes stop_codon:yes gene_type:complete